MSESPRAGGGPLALLFSVPSDIWLVLAGLLDAYLAVLLPPGNPARILIALVTLLILPGYALTTVVFPAARSSRGLSPTSLFRVTDKSPLSHHGRGEGEAGPAALSGVERAALSFGLSVALLPLFGLVLQVAYGGYQLEALLTVLTVFVLAAMAVGVVRRYRVPADERYDLPVDEWMAASRAVFLNTRGIDLALNVALALALIVAASTLTLAVVAPQDGSQFTEAYLLAPEDDGDLAAKNYPTEFNRSEAQPLAIAIENREGEAVTYTVVVELQRLDSDGSVLEDARLDQFQQRVAAGESWQERHNVTPTLVGENLRLTYLVYRGEPPSEISAETAYRDVSLKINVSAPTSARVDSEADSATGEESASVSNPGPLSAIDPDGSMTNPDGSVTDPRASVAGLSTSSVTPALSVPE